MSPRSSTAKKFLTLLTVFSMLALSSAPTVFAAPPNTAFDDFFTTQEYLEPASQANPLWTNTIPNALASYFTFMPLSNADAIAVGFPAACGNPNTVTNPYTNTVIHTPLAGDTSSTADCYIISVRKFKQPTSLDFLKFVLPEFPVPVTYQAADYATTGASTMNLFPGPGLLNPGTSAATPPATTPFVDTTSVTTFRNTVATGGTIAWGYGSGGIGWQPYGSGGPTIRGNAPWAFQTTPFNYIFGTAPTGDQSVSTTGTGGTGVWHFPAPSIKGTGRIPGTTTGNRPIYIQWLNDLPNETTPGLDPTVDCGVNTIGCSPYNRIVTHVHGAHVGPESDGLTTAWYTPDFLATGEGFYLPGSYLYNAPAGKAAAIGPIYFYPMDQEAGTIWYHDHASGSTHLNTNQGMAGFFPITDSNETALQTGNVLPSGNFELGFALQDRHFDINAQMVMPNYAIYDKTTPGCVDLPSGVPDPAFCPRVQFLKEADTSVTGFHFIPDTPANRTLVGFGSGLNPTTGCTSNPNGPYEVANQCAPFGAASATLEYFGVMPVVNGVTYGKYPVNPGVYRMRFLGGTDSRAWIMQLQQGDGTPIPFWQIGSEQGLLDKPVQRDIIDLMSGERIDVLVDFNTLPKDLVGDPTGNTLLATRVYLKNLGEDAPYAGNLVTEPGTPPVPATVIPDIMVFDVAGALINYNSTNPATLAGTAGSPLRPTTPLPPLGTTAYTRTISLVEITDNFGRTMPTIDARGYRPTEVPITENILIDQIEQWDIINTTVDAHPMHLHQVAFQLINRQAVNDFAAPINNLGEATYNPSFPLFPANGLTLPSAVYAAAQYAPVGAVIAPQPYEALALKDTIDCPPSYVTRIQAKFDILGTYLWHCHILSHEEHDMMRPFRVVANKLAAPAWMSVPATADANGKAYVIVGPTTSPVTGAQYVVQFRKVGAPFWHTNQSAIRNPLVDLKVDPAKPETADLGPGTYEFRAQVVNQIFQVTAPTNYADSDWKTTASTTVYSNPAAPSPWFTVPANATPAAGGAGTIYVIAGASYTPGALYNFQYKLTADSVWTDALLAQANRNVTITLPAAGTYDIRTFVTATNYTASTFKTGTTTVAAVSAAASPWFSVPATPAPGGKVYVIAGASYTTGARYNFQYRLVGSGTWLNGPLDSAARNVTITLPAPGNYEFQTYVTAAGYSPSAVRPGSNNCNFAATQAAPAPWFSVPASTTTGNIYVIAGASATAGVNYSFEYSTSGAGGPWTAIGVVGVRNQTLTLPAASGATYTMRVTVVDPAAVFTPSNPTLGNNTVVW